MENTQQLIEDFFNEKIQEAISTGYEEILKKIRDKKNNHKHKEYLETCTKEEDVLESNQWMREKLNKLEILFHNDEKISELIKASIGLYEKIHDQDELKKNLATQFKSLKKEVIKSESSEQDKKIFDEIEAEKIQPDKFKKNKRLLEKLIEIDLEIQIVMADVKKLSQEKFERSTWITEAALKASEVSIGMTHIAKLTHSSTKASNIDAMVFEKNTPKNLVVTANFSNELKKDFSYTSARYSQIAEFLQLTGKAICTNPTALKPYAQDDAQIKQWQEQFNIAFNEKSKSSHTLAKQVYFPLYPDSGYHLLTPLMSSSLVQVIHDRIWEARRKDTPANKAKADKTFSTEVARIFLKTSVLKTTQTNHQNVSNLNGKRSGQLILFPAIPPQWKNQTKPPIYLKTLFNKQLAYEAKEPLKELKNLLLAIKANKLSANLQRKKLIRNHITDIADVVFDYAAHIQGLQSNIGWSQKSQLPANQQYWLDPLRPDDDFQAAKNTLDWSNDLVIEFSKWVDTNINHKQLTKSTAREKLWQKLFTPLLREFNALVEADLENSTMEESV
jgi:CRISPR-associated protein Csy1